VKKNARFDHVVLLIVRVGKEGLWSLLILKRLVLRKLIPTITRLSWVIWLLYRSKKMKFIEDFQRADVGEVDVVDSQLGI
jgi:hypothetical protein